MADYLIVEEEARFTLTELGRVCRTDTTVLIELVHEGVLEPTGTGPQDWSFSGSVLGRARNALRLGRELHLDAHGVAVVLDLLDEIEGLKARLRRVGAL